MKLLKKKNPGCGEGRRERGGMKMLKYSVADLYEKKYTGKVTNPAYDRRMERQEAKESLISRLFLQGIGRGKAM